MHLLQQAWQGVLLARGKVLPFLPRSFLFCELFATRYLIIKFSRQNSSKSNCMQAKSTFSELTAF